MLTASSNERTNTRGRLAIIAGRGRLPLDVAEAATAAGDAPFVIAIEGQADSIPDSIEHEYVTLGDAVRIQELVTGYGIERVIMSGGIDRRPEFRDIRLPLRFIPRLPGLLRTLRGSGDDKVLRAVITLFEQAGCRVLGAQEVVPDLLAEDRTLTALEPSEKDWRNILAAYDGADRLGELDVGQGAVSVGGRIVALEGPEGTDEMLKRVADLRESQRITKRPGGVLVKLCKRHQDLRADLPSIGPDTVTRAKQAGLSGIALEAGRAFVLDRDQVVTNADASSMFVTGITRQHADEELAEQRKRNGG